MGTRNHVKYEGPDPDVNGQFSGGGTSAGPLFAVCTRPPRALYASVRLPGVRVGPVHSLTRGTGEGDKRYSLPHWVSSGVLL